jgi:hypothetical protein
LRLAWPKAKDSSFLNPQRSQATATVASQSLPANESGAASPSWPF